MDREHLLALAITLLEGTTLGQALSEIDARPLPDIVRMFHIRELIGSVFPRIWDELGLDEQFGDDAAFARELLFETLCLAARARGGKRRRRIEWSRFGESEATGSPAESSDKQVGYALIHDPRRETAVYISGSSTETFGQTWVWQDGAWKAHPAIEHAIAEPHKQGFRGFYESARQGVACWTLVPHEPANFERYHPLGLLVTPDGIDLIEAENPPVVPSEMLFVFGAIFGQDPASGDTIMLARDALYALRDGAWQKLCDLDESVTSHEWEPYSRASFEHDGALYFCWTDKDGLGSRSRLLRFTGHGVDEIRPREAPRRGFRAVLSDGAGARFVRRGKQWRLAGSGDETTWERVPSAARLPEFRRAWGAVLPSGEILVGPGEHDDGSDDTRYQRIFLHVRADGHIQPLGESLEGVGACPADRTLLGHRDRVLAVYADGRVDRVHGGVCERLAESLPHDLADTTFILSAICLDPDGHIIAVATDASVWRHGADDITGWERIGAPDDQVATWTLAACAWDPPRDRLVVWGYLHDADKRSAERTGVWRDRAWSRIEAGSILPPGDKYLRGDMDNQMVFDTHHQAVVLFGATSIALFEDDRWHPTEPEANIYRGASTGSALLVHDPGSATTLFVDTKDRWCGRLDGGQLEQVGRLRRAPDRLSTFANSAQARRAAMVYVPASSSVVVYASGADYDHFWELPLADILSSVERTGERKEFARNDPTTRRFTGPRLRRIEPPASDQPAASADHAIHFQRFGRNPPDDWQLPTQTSDEFQMVHDPVNLRFVLVRASHRATECWHRSGQAWQLLHTSESGPFSATVRLSSDPGRGAVLWFVDERHGTSGYRIADHGLVPLETSGDGPVRSDDYDHRDKMAFAWDTSESRLLAFSTEGLWALSDDDAWSRLATWDGATPLHQVDSFRDRDGGAWDAVGQRLVMWRFDRSDGLCCWSVSDAGVVPLQEAGIDDADGCLLTGSDSGLILYNGAQRTLSRLEATGWVERAAAQAPNLGPELDRIPDASMACHDGGREPGAPSELTVHIGSWRPFRFHTRENGTWHTHGQPAGVDQPTGATLIGRHDDALFVTDGMSAWIGQHGRWQPVPNLMETFFQVSWRKEVGHGVNIVCVAHEPGPARVLCETGVIAQLTDHGWDLERPQGDTLNRDGFYDRVAAYSPTDGSWLVFMRDAERALTFHRDRHGPWKEVCAFSFSDQVSAYTTRQLVYDTRLSCFVLAGQDGVFHLRDNTWQQAAIQHLPECDRLVHDTATGATLIIQIDGGKVYRLGASSITELSRTIAPPLPTRQRRVRGMPSASEILIDATARRLVWIDAQDVWGNYELDLTGHLEQARALGQLDP